MTLHEADFLARKGKKPITMLTAYTCPVARGIEAAGVPVILVGDTVGMVEMGFESTRDVTLEHMEYHIGAVRRGAPNTHIIGDLPYLTDVEPHIALTSARRLIAAGANSIKLEGPKDEVIRHLVANGIPVVGHTGLTPQTATSFKKVGTKGRIGGAVRSRTISEVNVTIGGPEVGRMWLFPTVPEGAPPACRTATSIFGQPSSSMKPHAVISSSASTSTFWVPSLPSPVLSSETFDRPLMQCM